MGVYLKVDTNLIQQFYSEDGLSTKKIASKMGISQTKVTSELNRIGIQIRHQITRDKYNQEEIKRLYCEEKKSSRQIAAILSYDSCTVRNILKSMGLSRSRVEALAMAETQCRIPHPCGKDNPNFKGENRMDMQKYGYILIYKPKHPKARKDGYVLEHILIWEQVHNKPLPKGWVVHHLNGIKTDNRPENLVGFTTMKHALVLAEKAKRIRELEAKVKLLEKALDNSQMIFTINEN